MAPRRLVTDRGIRPRTSSIGWHDFRGNVISSTRNATNFEETPSPRRGARPTLRKRHLLDEERDQLRGNAVSSTRSGTNFEETPSPRRGARPTSRKRHLLDEERDQLRGNVISSTRNASNFEESYSPR